MDNKTKPTPEPENPITQEGKIGFEVIDVKKQEKKIKKFQQSLPGRPLRITTKVFTIVGVIFSALTLMYFFLPVFSAFIGLILTLLVILFMIFTVIITMGLVLLNEEYRYWIGNHLFDIPLAFFNVVENIAILSPFFPIVAVPGTTCCLVGLILSLVGINKKMKYFTSYVVLNSIFFIIAFFFLLAYIITGAHIVS